MILLLASRASSREAAAASAEPMAVPCSLIVPRSNWVVQAEVAERAAQPLVVERDRAGIARPAGEGDQAHAVVRPAADEVIDDHFRHIDALHPARPGR